MFQKNKRVTAARTQRTRGLFEDARVDGRWVESRYSIVVCSYPAVPYGSPQLPESTACDRESRGACSPLESSRRVTSSQET